MPLPKAIANAPDLAFGLEFIYRAFWDLSSCRPVGFGVGHIPWAVIRDYAICYGIDEDGFDDFIHLIREMDKEYVEYIAAKKPAEPPKKRA